MVCLMTENSHPLTIRWSLGGRKPGTFSKWHKVEGGDLTACQRLIPDLVALANDLGFEGFEISEKQPATCKLCLRKKGTPTK